MVGKAATADEHAKQASARHWTWTVLLLIILLVTAAVRWRLLDVPLERDEGEYAYAAQLILQGIPPYEQVYNMKLPGIYAAYAVVLALFGESPGGVHLGLLVINGATIVLVFLLTRHLMGGLSAVVAAASFAVLSTSQPVLGVFANAEHFVILPALGGLVVLVRSIETDRLLPFAWSGLCLGLAFLMKQHGGAFVALGGLYLLIESLRTHPLHWRRFWSRCALFTLAAAAPFLITCLLLWILGVFDNFWFWTVTYARAYLEQVSPGQAPTQFMVSASPVVRATPLVWGLAAMGLTAICWDQHARKHWLFIILLTAFSFLAICPGFYFRPHYFILLLPAAALLAGVASGAVANLLAKTRLPVLGYGVGGGLALTCIAASIVSERQFLFMQTPAELTRATYGRNPFPESPEIARIVRTHTTDADRIAVIGSEPQIYFYAARRAATGYIYTYPLMERHDFALEMQREMIREIEAADPAVLVFVNVWPSWLEMPGSHRLIFEWFDNYSRAFTLIAVADISPDGTRYYLGNDLAKITQRPRNSVEVYRRGPSPRLPP